MKKFYVYFLMAVLIVLIGVALFTVGSAQAAGRCEEVPGQGWHIVGAGADNDHFYETETACLIDLQVPTALATLQATNDESTQEPTETVVPTETTLPTDIPTESPTEPPVVAETPFPTPWDNPTTFPPVETVVPATPVPGGGHMNCKKAWKMITETVYNQDVGWRFFDNPNHHNQCKVWLMNRYGIDYDVYRVMHYFGG